MNNKLTKKHIYNLLRHLIFKNVAILSSLEASKNQLRMNKLPLWIHGPVEEMFVELIQDLHDSLVPVLDIATKEYEGRVDRMAIVNDSKERLQSRKDSQEGYEECHCVGCEDNGSEKL